MGGASCPSCATRHSLGCWLKARCDFAHEHSIEGQAQCLPLDAEQEQKMAWLYHPIAERKSSSSDKVYTVCIREDDRISDADARRQAARLTCNCAGWVQRCPGGLDENRTCRHVKQEADALRRFKASASAKVAQPAAPKSVPTMPKGKAVPATALTSASSDFGELSRVVEPRQPEPERVDATGWVTLTEAPKVRSTTRAAALEL